MIKGTYIKNSISFALLAVMMCFLFIWNINSGSVHLSVEEIGGILFRRTGEAASYRIVWDIRLPRILSAVILGGALSVSGFLLQTSHSRPFCSGDFIRRKAGGIPCDDSFTGKGKFRRIGGDDSGCLSRLHDFHGICPDDFR